MRVAQTLYEAGYITYMRTDSTHLSGDALAMARVVHQERVRRPYLPEKPNFYTSQQQERAGSPRGDPPDRRRPSRRRWRAAKLGADESKLYQLIWNRFVACQMPPAEFDQTTVTIAAPTKEGDAVFRATGRKLVFDGFMKVAGVSSEDQLLPELTEQQPVFPIEIDPTQHFTQPPPRFTEASLVKELEQLGIGRPSTYASIIQTIQDREYVEQIDRRFYATMLGMRRDRQADPGVPRDHGRRFTADMELKLDKIEEQHLDWIKLLQDFYGPFHAVVDGALEKIEHAGGAPSARTSATSAASRCSTASARTASSSRATNRECSDTQPVDEQGKPTRPRGERAQVPAAAAR